MVEETSDYTGSKVYVWLRPPMINRAFQRNVKCRHSIGPTHNADRDAVSFYIDVTDTSFGSRNLHYVGRRSGIPAADRSHGNSRGLIAAFIRLSSIERRIQR